MLLVGSVTEEWAEHILATSDKTKTARKRSAPIDCTSVLGSQKEVPRASSSGMKMRLYVATLTYNMQMLHLLGSWYGSHHMLLGHACLQGVAEVDSTDKSQNKVGG